MKKLFTLLMLAVFACGTMMANWQPSDTEAIRLDKEDADGQVQMKTIRTPEGKIILSWLRGERVDGVFSYRLHLQVFDADGNAQFGDEGIIVCDKPTRTWTTDYSLELAQNGDILLAYNDVRNDPENQENTEVYLYRYTQQGEPVWDVDGILFPAELIHENAFAVEDVSPKICVSGDNIYVAAMHTEYYREEANEDNWSPSPWFPNQQMPDSVDVSDNAWLLLLVNDEGELVSEEPLKITSKILVMKPSTDGNIFFIYDNENLSLDAQMVNADLENVWDEVKTIEERPLSSGMYMPTPLAELDDEGGLFLSYRALESFSGYQVLNHLNADGTFLAEAPSCNNSQDGDAGSAYMGVKEDVAFVAWEYEFSDYFMNVNVLDAVGDFCWPDDYRYGRLVVKMDDFGEIMWSKQICEDNFKSSGFSIVYDENNAYIFYTQETQYDDDWNEIPGSAGMYVMCVDISGQSHTAVNEVEAGQPVKTEIYTLDGRRVNELENGVNILRITDANGNVTSKKVLK